MNRIALLLLAALCGSTALFAQSAVSVPLRNPHAVVATTYAQIATQRMADRRATYGQLPVQMQEDLWTLHLTYFLADHPDLPQSQKAIVLGALGFFQSGLLEADRSSAAWTSTLSAAAQLDAQARNERSKVLMDALSQLGGTEIVYPAARGDRLRTEISVGGECECSTAADLCCFGDCPTSPSPKCARTRPYCYGTAGGCGWGWVYDCNGICGPL
jgi:hypothetical protein